ncbi:MAG: hypothetical protein JNM86_14575 [Phycisphaerae bacterium]|nr:hypothetical protein [Phycisphaerae bacterium]
MRLITKVLGVGVAALFASGALAGTLAWKNRMPEERLNVRMAYDSSRHTTLMFGGQNRNSGSITYFNDTWIWNGSIWIEREVPGPSARSSYAMAYDSARGVTVLFGGKNAGGINNETWEWNGVQWTQRVVAGPPARSGASMCFDPTRNVVVLFGGFTTTYLGDTWEWDGTTWTQRAVTGPAPRTGSAFAYDSARGHAVLYGGLRGSPMNGTPLLTNETWTWDGTAWTQIAVTGPQALQNTSAAFDSARGVIVLFGGGTTTSGLGTASNQTWEWNGTAWTKRANGTAATAHAIAYVPENSGVIVFGGLPASSSNSMGDVRRWNGTAWDTPAFHGPRARTDLGMTYNTLRERSVVACGYYAESGNFIATNDMWEWDGSNWLGAGSAPSVYRGGTTFDTARGVSVYFGGEVPPNFQATNTTYERAAIGGWINQGVTGPSARVWTSMVFDSARSVSVLFGGGTSSFYAGNGDTWEWNGTAWTERAVSGPPKRYAQMMSYDSARGVTVLFGGVVTTSGSNVWSADTWEYDGTTWTQKLVSGPPRRSMGAMAYDAARGKTVLYGGVDGTGSSVFRSDTWEWDGTAWTQAVISGPPPVAAAGMVYDPERRVMVLFGGESTALSTYYSSQTWELVAVCPGDLNSDFVVDDADFSGFASAYDMLDCADPAMPLACPADLNGDLVVDDLDFVLFAQAYDALLCD